MARGAERGAGENYLRALGPTGPHNTQSSENTAPTSPKLLI